MFVRGCYQKHILSNHIQNEQSPDAKVRKSNVIHWKSLGNTPCSVSWVLPLGFEDLQYC